MAIMHFNPTHIIDYYPVKIRTHLEGIEKLFLKTIKLTNSERYYILLNAKRKDLLEIVESIATYSSRPCFILRLKNPNRTREVIRLLHRTCLICLIYVPGPESWYIAGILVPKVKKCKKGKDNTKLLPERIRNIINIAYGS